MKFGRISAIRYNLNTENSTNIYNLKQNSNLSEKQW